MADTDRDEYADLLAGTKLEQLLEGYGADDFTASRELSDHLIAMSAGAEFLISKGQIRITFDLKPSTPPAPAPDPE